MGGKYLFKILTVGVPEYQKSILLKRYTSGQFDSDTKETIGVDFAIHYLESPNIEGAATLQIWDFGEHERFGSMVPSFCQGASGALLYFDLLFPLSVMALEIYIQHIRRNTRDIPLLLCGLNYSRIKNPKNLEPDHTEIVLKFIKQHNLNGYVSIDIKTGFQVNEMFEKITELMINHHLDRYK